MGPCLAITDIAGAIARPDPAKIQGAHRVAFAQEMPRKCPVWTGSRGNRSVGRRLDAVASLLLVCVNASGRFHRMRCR